MGIWHIDPACESALINLNTALCSFERMTGREYLLMLVPKSSDEQICISQNGKPLSQDFDINPEEILTNMIKRRR
ncbi:MAG: hypothetical protein CEN89_321 [Candidatus Berkelbacteria bacterium Licking1014_7]|uniref:Uncharacterized protein n=1 Tax=Candidatus Berkelbacteria bacterium Licking1014_7 TaxID=2017147 RepID=A0A554LJP3_9BACT|nr:MAG: hypothetical protein CEN89_321 [Candidatus Berkelbacteria bacterium Licking1014_7]